MCLSVILCVCADGSAWQATTAKCTFCMQLTCSTHQHHPCLSAIRCACADGFKLPVWGEGGKGVDIAVAYEKAAAAVLGQRAKYLIFAQGLMAARDLRAVAKRPLVLRTSYPDGPAVKNQLVYEVRLCLPCLRLE